MAEILCLFRGDNNFCPTADVTGTLLFSNFEDRQFKQDCQTCGHFVVKQVDNVFTYERLYSSGYPEVQVEISPRAS